MMMTYVAATDAKMCNVGHIAEPGRPVQKIALPAEVSGYLLRAETLSEETRVVIPLAIKTVRRIAPWVTIIAAPRLYRPFTDDDTGRAFYVAGDGRFWVGIGGSADPAKATVAISTDHPPDTLLLYSLHEAFHALEARMPSGLVERIDQHLASDSYGNALGGYWALPWERRARAFAAWAMRLMEGMPAPKMDLTPDFSLDEIFAAAWLGDLGQQFNQGGGRKAA